MAPSLDLIGGAGGAAASFLIDSGLVRASILLILAGACVLALRRWSAAARHLVLGVVFAALLLLPAATLLAPGWRLLPGGGADGAAASQVAVLPAGPVRPAVPEPRRTPPPTAAGPSAPAAQPARPSSPFPTGAVVLGAWLAGVLAVALRFGIGTARLARLRRRAAVPSAAITARGLRRARELGLGRRVEVLLSPEVAVPLTFGLRRPVVLLPQAAGIWPGERLDAALSHELAHVRRRDCETQAMATLACALHWFNPLVWLAAWRLRTERERACDDRVLVVGVRPTDYASQLVAVARTGLAARAAQGPAVAMARGSGLERRVRAILDGRQRRRAPSRLAIAAVVLAAAGLLAPLATLAAQGPAQAVPAMKAAPGSVPLSVFERPRTAADRLPRWVSGDPVVRQRGIDSRTSRLALTDGRRGFYVVEARSRTSAPLVVCLIDAPLRTPARPAPSSSAVSGPGGAGGVNCQTESVLGSSFMAAPMSLRSSGGRTVVDVDGAVPDGFTTVTSGTRSTSVVSNVFVLRGIDPRRPLVASGPAGQRTYSLGFAPPAPRPLPGALLPMSLLSRPLTPADRPPIDRAHLAPGGGSNTDWRQARLGATVGQAKYYVAPTLNRRRLMVLAATKGRIGGVAGILRPAVGLPFSFMTIAEGSRRPSEPGSYTLAGVAADGYDRVSAAGRSAPIRDNFFVLTGIAGVGVTKVTASGPAVSASGYIVGNPGQSRDHIPSGVVRRP